MSVNTHNTSVPLTTRKPVPAAGNGAGYGAGYDDQTPRGPYGQKFSFVQWARLHIIDLVTMAAMGAVGLGVYEAHPAPTRSFPVYNTDGAIAYPQFAYPLRKNIIPIWLAALLAFIVPFVFFVMFQIRIRSLDHLLNTTMGLLESLSTSCSSPSIYSGR
jgi:diacylglycerol diphosphate phosphatase/phosphatidate phosphatase